MTETVGARLEPAHVQTMLKGIERYNPTQLTTFEAYVAQQMKEGTHDLEANLAVLKLYQFNNNAFNLDVVHDILIKALTALPETAFTLCLFLVPEEYHQEPELVTVMMFYELLEKCEFLKFWKELANAPDITLRAAGFEESIRGYVKHVISISCKSIDAPTLKSYLNIDGDAFKAFIAEATWRQEGEMIYTDSSLEDEVKPKNIQENLEFAQLGPLLSSTA